MIYLCTIKLIIVQQKFFIYYVTHSVQTNEYIFRDSFFVQFVQYFILYTVACIYYDLSSRGFRKAQNGTREKAADIQKRNFLFIRSRRIACNCTFSKWDAQDPVELN